MASVILTLTIIWATASVPTFPHAFTQSNRSIRPSNNAAASMRPRYRYDVSSLESQKESSSPGDENENEEENQDLLDELRNAKKDIFGADIPSTVELEGAAKVAEDAFLAAMLEQTGQFRRIKSEEGSEKAVDVFMGRIQEADEASSERDRERFEEWMREEEDEDSDAGGAAGEIRDDGKETWQ